MSKRAPHILDTLGCLLFRAGNVDEAVSIQKEALERATDDGLRKEIEERLVQFQAVQTLHAQRSAGESKGK